MPTEPPRRLRLPVLSSSLSRRGLIRLFGGAAVALAAKPGCTSSSTAGNVFSDDERNALSAFADVIIPPDDEPGGAALGAVDYTERLFTAFDDDTITPPIFAGGPFSGRLPNPDATGNASTDFPPNDFVNFIELDRVNEASWRLKILGSAGLPNGGPNDKINGPIQSMAEELKTGLHAAMQSAGSPITQLSSDDLLALFNSQDPNWKSLVVELVTEAAFAAPEYGGNIGLAGWKICHFEGDSQPLGYSQWNGTAYVERPDSPLSTANPGADPAPIDSDVDGLLQLVVAFLGGRTS